MTYGSDNLGLHNQINTVTKALVDQSLPVFAAGLLPGPQRSLVQNYLRDTRPENPTTRNIYTGTKVAKGISNLTAGVKGIVGTANKTKLAGSFKNWWGKGRNVRVPNENTASWAKLRADDLSQVGKFRSPTGSLEPGLLGTGLPKNFNQLGQFVQGKGGLTWSATRGVPTGPTASVRQTFERPIRAINALTPTAKTTLGGAALATIGGGTKTIGGALDSGVSPEAKLKSGIGILEHPWTQAAADWTQGDAWYQKAVAEYASDTLDYYTRDAREQAKDVPGLIPNIVARTQAHKLNKRLGADDIPRALDTITGTYNLATRYGANQPGIGAELGARWTQAGEWINNKPVRSVREIYTGEGPDKVSRARLNTDRDRSRGRMTVRAGDYNKIAEQTYNPYLQSGQAARDEQDLTQFWSRQNQLNTAATQRLNQIQSSRSDYTKLASDLTTRGTAYTQELDRLKPYDKSYSDELARLKPYGKQYSDELARLQPYDKQFTSSIADLTKGRDELKGYRGQWTHPDDVKFLDENIPAYDKAISDLESQYKSYQTSIADLTKGQKDYQSYLGNVQSGYKEYQSYLGEVQTGQKELADYTKQIDTERSQLEDYYSAFTSAKQASDQAARSYTVRTQQGLSGAVKKGVSGIRTRGGFSTIGSNRDKSPKRRFNRDFRIQSLNV